MDINGYILAINPGSTSTKVALFKSEILVKQKILNHSIEEINRFEKVFDQLSLRMDSVLNWLEEEKIKLLDITAVVGRGGILKPIPGGTYIVTEKMIEDLKSGEREEHASNLGAVIAKEIAERCNRPAYIVDPVSVDEFDDLARISGHPELPRISMVHALNIKAISRRAAIILGKDLKDMNLVVAHLGGGISICPVKGGKLIDANVATEGGPFSPDRSGTVPVGDLVRLAYSNKYSEKQLRKKLIGGGGLIGYLGTNDVKSIERRIDEGDCEAQKIFEAMCYQISKEIIGMATVLYGKVDLIVLTGGLAYSRRLVQSVSKRIKFLAPIEIIPGEDEMLSLAQGAYRVLTGQEKAKIYENEVIVK